MSVTVSPLYSVVSRPQPRKSTKSQSVPHSAFQDQRSQHYHEHVVGTERELNPTRQPSIEKIRTGYPGL
jgi:hypothetical protein